jgi:O-antigen ligase
MLIAAASLLMLVSLLVNGSRAGLLIGALALALGLALYASLLYLDVREAREEGPAKLARYIAIGAVVVGVALALTLMFAQAPSIERLLTSSTTDELRARIFPQVAAMAQQHWLAGTGFGSFEYAYKMYETSDTLSDVYVNNAHNDWMQWVIEGGLPAILIAIAGTLWLLRMAVAHLHNRESNPARFRLVCAAFAVLALLMLASALDYPLRVPSMMLYFVLMTAIVADPPEPLARLAKRGNSKRSGGGHRGSLLRRR